VQSFFVKDLTTFHERAVKLGVTVQAAPKKEPWYAPARSFLTSKVSYYFVDRGGVKAEYRDPDGVFISVVEWNMDKQLDV
jgi:hypothetical protein